MRSEDSTTGAHRVRFSPPGFNREEKVGSIFQITRDDYHGTTYFVEDTEGTKYQLGPGAILAPEETGL